jgi:serine/threonine protein phosphatase PrpC
VAGLLELQVKSGEISQVEAEANPNRHKLTSALNGDTISMIDISKEIPFELADVLILASDGVETLTKWEILEIISNRSDIYRATENIISVIENRGKYNQDNATLISVEFMGAKKKADYLKREKKNSNMETKKAFNWMSRVYRVIEPIVYTAMVTVLGLFIWGMYYIYLFISNIHN